MSARPSSRINTLRGVVSFVGFSRVDWAKYAKPPSQGQVPSFSYGSVQVERAIVFSNPAQYPFLPGRILWRYQKGTKNTLEENVYKICKNIFQVQIKKRIKKIKRKEWTYFLFSYLTLTFFNFKRPLTIIAYISTM